jgi:hypothetical protein
MTIEEMRTIDAVKTWKELEEAKERIKRLERFINRFFGPEDLGYVVGPVVRDDAREALGMKRVESEIRESKI